MKKVFISYSHDDGDMVVPVVSLLRATGSFVFLDKDSIEPGKKWRERLELALTDANMLVVFWCHHSDKSKEVKKEWERAIALKKDVLPILLDQTPLPQELAEFQYIDFGLSLAKFHNHKVKNHVAQPRTKYGQLGNMPDSENLKMCRGSSIQEHPLEIDIDGPDAEKYIAESIESKLLSELEPEKYQERQCTNFLETIGGIEGFVKLYGK